MEKESSERRSLIFVDSSYFIAFADKADRWHKNAVKLSENIKTGVVVSDYVIVEAVSTIGHRGGGKAGADLYDFLVHNFQVTYVDEELLKQSMDVYLGYDGTLSVADAVSVEVMRRRGINKIVSFDADFDKVVGISRIH
jgi:hypothetical protein